MTGIMIKLRLLEYGFKKTDTIDGKICFVKGDIIISIYRTSNKKLLVRLTAGNKATMLLNATDIKNVLEVENSLYITDSHSNDIELRYSA